MHSLKFYGLLIAIGYADIEQRLKDLEIGRITDKIVVSNTASYTTITQFFQTLESARKSTIEAVHPEWKNTAVKYIFQRSYKVGGEDVVQKDWAAFVSKIECHTEVQFVDSHKMTLLAGKSPDIVIQRKDQSHTLFNVVAIGELKGSSGSFTDANKGQLCSYLITLLEKQKFRHFALGFLTNNVSILVVEANRTPSNDFNFIWFIDESFKSGGAQKALSWLSDLSLVQHGYTLPQYPSIKHIIDYLGSGSVAHVYCGVYKDDTTVVVKEMRDVKRVKHESSILRKLQSLKHIPELVKLYETALILKPRANRCSVFQAFQLNHQDIFDIVNALFKAHQLNIVHRDVRDPNIFKVE